ncbi:hypothetical protein Hdeb2414_s0108g00797311 [Helianthus debilis subsp. tardiflorus]
MKDYDGKVTTEEVASAAIYLKDTLGKEGLLELISNQKGNGKWLNGSANKKCGAWNCRRRTRQRTSKFSFVHPLLASSVLGKSQTILCHMFFSYFWNYHFRRSPCTYY